MSARTRPQGASCSRRRPRGPAPVATGRRPRRTRCRRLTRAATSPTPHRRDQPGPNPGPVTARRETHPPGPNPPHGPRGPRKVCRSVRNVASPASPQTTLPAGGASMIPTSSEHPLNTRHPPPRRPATPATSEGLQPHRDSVASDFARRPAGNPPLRPSLGETVHTSRRISAHKPPTTAPGKSAEILDSATEPSKKHRPRGSTPDAHKRSRHQDILNHQHPACTRGTTVDERTRHHIPIAQNPLQHCHRRTPTAGKDINHPNHPSQHIKPTRTPHPTQTRTPQAAPLGGVPATPTPPFSRPPDKRSRNPHGE